jgi:ribosomal protein S18 acetylase RimI-like enzyme
MTTGTITLRPISELDIEGVCAIDEKITGNYAPKDWEERFAYYLRRDPLLCLVAEDEGNIVGFMLGEVKAGEFGLTEPAGWIEVMGVDPECRGKSVGRRLLEGMLENFSARGAKTVRTLVDSDSQKQLEGFFVAMNFKETPIHMLEYPL